MRFRRSEFSEAEVDMTSMLDVVFIMLIFFIVTSSFVKESGLTFARPSATAVLPTTEKRALLLTVDAEGNVVADGRAIDKRAIPAWIEQASTAGEVSQVIVQAHSNGATQDLVAIVDSIKSAGVERVSVGTFD